MSKERIYIGIDPGASGGVAVYSPDTGKVTTYAMPETYPDIFMLLKGISESLPPAPVTVVLEDVGQGMPGQSSSSTAKFARHNGHLEMALYALGMGTEKVKPQKWQRFYSNTLGRSSACEKREWKNRLKGEAQRLFPSEKVTLKTADAILLAYYGARTYKP